MSNILAAPADLILRFDANLLGQLVNDENTQLTPTQLLSDPVTQAHLDDAAGMVLAALYTAYKYTPTELSQVTPTSASLLKRLCCDLAIVMICQRRGYDYSDKFPMLGISLTMIQQLRNGERVLDLASNEEAGLVAATRVGSVQQMRAGLVTANWHLFPLPGAGAYGAWPW